MSKSSTKPMLIMLVAVGILFGGIYGFQQFRNKMIVKIISSQGIPPQAVSVTTANKQTWHIFLDANGSLHASRSTNLTTESGGLITGIHFHSGEKTTVNSLLLTLNTAPLTAQLKQLQANEKLAQINYDRDTAQLKIQAVSQSTVDSDAQALQSAKAQIAMQQATIAQKMIRAPFTGKLGIRQVDLGQYLAPGATVVSLQQMDPMYVDFDVPQTALSSVHVGDVVDAETDALPGKKLTGTIRAIEPQVDSSTRNIKVRASIPNPDGRLLPNLFMVLHIHRGINHQYITLPATAIAYNPYGSTVFVVHDKGHDANGKPKLIVEQRVVITGATRGDQVAVLHGVEPGETIVTSGQLKLHNGAPVFINNSIQPLNDPHPEVGDE